MPKIGMEPVRREEIVRATLKLIASEGLASVTLDRIAAGAGVSKGVVSYYYKNKQEVILSSFKVLLDHYYTMLDQPFPEGTSFSEGLLYVAGFIVSPGSEVPFGLTGEDYKRLMVCLMELALTDDDFRRMMRGFYLGFRDWFREMIDKGIRSGELPQGGSPALSLGMMALLDGLMLYSALDLLEPGTDPAELARCLTGRMLGLPDSAVQMAIPGSGSGSGS